VVDRQNPDLATLIGRPNVAPIEPEKIDRDTAKATFEGDAAHSGIVATDG